MATEETISKVEIGVSRSVLRRSHRVPIYLNDFELKELKAKAKALHLPFSVYLRMACLNYRRKD